MVELPDMPSPANGFNRWIVGIVAALVVLSVAGSVLFDRELSSKVAEQGALLQNLSALLESRRADIRQSGDFNRTDADRELHARDVAIENLERRVRALEQRR